MGKMNGGGVEQVVLNYYNHLDRERIQFDFIIDEDSTSIPYNEIESLGGRVFVIPPYQKIHYYLKALDSLFKEEKWAIVHSHLNALSVFPLWAAKRARIPIRIAHAHSTASKNEPTKTAIKNILRPFSTRYATHRLACSLYAGNWLFGNKSDFATINNAIDLKKFLFDPKTRSLMRKELGIPQDSYVVGHVGRFATQKNHHFLIDFFSKALNENPDLILVLVGEGELKQQIIHEVKNRGIENSVVFLNQRNDIEKIYQVFDVFVLPSLYEGLPVVGVEAQASGLTCLLSDQITDEIKLTEHVAFFSIDDASLWSKEVLKLPSRKHDSELHGSAYDIEAASDILENFYLDLVKSDI